MIATNEKKEKTLDEVSKDITTKEGIEQQEEGSSSAMDKLSSSLSDSIMQKLNRSAEIQARTSYLESNKEVLSSIKNVNTLLEDDYNLTKSIQEKNSFEDIASDDALFDSYYSNLNKLSMAEKKFEELYSKAHSNTFSEEFSGSNNMQVVNNNSLEDEFDMYPSSQYEIERWEQESNKKASMNPKWQDAIINKEGSIHGSKAFLTWNKEKEELAQDLDESNFSSLSYTPKALKKETLQFYNSKIPFRSREHSKQLEANALLDLEQASEKAFEGEWASSSMII